MFWMGAVLYLLIGSTLGIVESFHRPSPRSFKAFEVIYMVSYVLLWPLHLYFDLQDGGSK